MLDVLHDDRVLRFVDPITHETVPSILCIQAAIATEDATATRPRNAALARAGACQASTRNHSGAERRSSRVEENAGSGPGAITSDGCAVEFYALLPVFGEPEIVHAAVPAGASILELGCGTGRILRPLAALGHPVTGVDDSPEMLARSPDLPTECSSIESLRLDRRFDAVLLASTMINADPVTRQGFLATVRHHLPDDGIAVFQQNPPEWFETFTGAEPVRDDPGGIRRIIRSARWEPPRMHVEIEYQVGASVWTHAWTSYQISDKELAGNLAGAGLRLGDWLTEDHTWFTARPA